MTLHTAVAIIGILIAWHLFAGWVKGWEDDE
jgi:hypothetical protein